MYLSAYGPVALRLVLVVSALSNHVFAAMGHAGGAAKRTTSVATNMIMYMLPFLVYCVEK